jgi:hypothetical protein
MGKTAGDSARHRTAVRCSVLVIVSSRFWRDVQRASYIRTRAN